MQTRYVPFAQLGTIQSAWDELVAQNAHQSIFIRRSVVALTAHVFANERHAGCLVTTDPFGVVVGIFPICRGEQGTWQNIAFDEVSDYSDALVNPYAQDLVFVEWHTWFSEHTQTNNITLHSIPELASLRAFAHWLTTHMRGWQVAETQQTVCPIISLPSSWEEYLHQIGRKQRHEVRRKMKIFTELGGTFEFISQPTTSDFTDFTKLHRASSSEKASYWNECTTTFFQRLFDIGVHEGWLQLSFAKLGTRRVAACFLFVEHDQWSLYNTGFDLNQAQSQAGNALLAWIIQRATMLGVKRFDFLRGDESYKFRMGAVAQPLYTLQLHKV